MTRTAAVWWGLLGMLVSLAGCQRPSEARASGTQAAMSSPPAASAPQARGAADDSAHALMLEAFPDWKGQQGYPMSVPVGDDKNGVVPVEATAEWVIEGDATHRVLIVLGTPSNRAWRAPSGHVAPINVAGYWFVLRDGRWFVSARRNSILWVGSDGFLGKGDPASLGPGHPALFLDSPWCGVGYCAGTLNVLEFGPDAVRLVLDAVPFRSDSSNDGEACGRLSGGARDRPAKEIDDLVSVPCGEITATWRLQKNPAADRDDIVIQFAGHKLAEDAVTHKPSVHAVSDRLVFRSSSGSYKPVSGRNPLRPA